ncbi:transposase, partial [Paracoccus aestuariivivens]|uniref:transposase n=1 Tax=Paracoccus aestuariivivens TaxID=1820333 RepID=UPI003CCD2A3C
GRWPSRAQVCAGSSPWASDQWRHHGSMHRHSPGSTRRLTLGADKAYDTAGFVAACRQACVTPHVARKSLYSAIDRRTIRHKGYVLSQGYRKRIEETFGRSKTVGGMVQTVYRGLERVHARFIFTLATGNLARLPRLLAVREPASPWKADCNSEQGRAET